jgi:hypothetical protein
MINRYRPIYMAYKEKSLANRKCLTRPFNEMGSKEYFSQHRHQHVRQHRL